MWLVVICHRMALSPPSSASAPCFSKAWMYHFVFENKAKQFLSRYDLTCQCIDYQWLYLLNLLNHRDCGQFQVFDQNQAIPESRFVSPVRLIHCDYTITHIGPCTRECALPEMPRGEGSSHSCSRHQRWPCFASIQVQTVSKSEHQFIRRTLNSTA